MVLNMPNQNSAALDFNLKSFLTSKLSSDSEDLNNKSYSETEYLIKSLTKAPDKNSTDDYNIGDLDIIYAQDGDGNYDEDMDTNRDSKISYREYLRYCEQNAKTEEKNSDTKILSDKTKFMTVSFGHVSNAYNKYELNIPVGKIESNI